MFSIQTPNALPKTLIDIPLGFVPMYSGTMTFPAET